MKELSVGKPIVSVAGFFLAVHPDDGRPVMFQLEGERFLPLFSTLAKCLEALEVGQVEGPAKIQRITNHDEFIDSVAGKVRLMLDPWRMEQGTTRFTELRFQ